MLKALIVLLLVMSGVAAAELISAYRTGELTTTTFGRGAMRYTVRRDAVRDTGASNGEFEGALAYQWGAVLLPLGGAAFLWRQERRSHRLDPFHPDNDAPKQGND